MSTESPPSRSRRFFRSWWVRYLLLSVVFVVVVYLVNDWRWQKKWAVYETDARARGVKIYLPEYDRSAEVPDADNFATTPLWKEVFAKEGKGPRATRLKKASELGQKLSEKSKPGSRPPRKNLANWRASLALNKESAKSDASVTDAAAVLRGLEFVQPELDELRDGLKRSQCFFPKNFASISDMPYAHFSVFQSAAKLFSLRSFARLSNGDGAGALDDIRSIFGLAGKLESEPTLIAGLVELFIVSRACQTISDGMDTGRWSEDQLREIEALVAGVNLIQRHLFSMQSERTYLNSIFAEYIVNGSRQRHRPLGAPTGLHWLIERYICSRSYVLRNQLWMNSAFDEELSMWDPAKEQWNPRKRLYSANQLEASWKKYSFFHVILNGFVYESAGNRALELHAKLRMAGLACALERYSMARGSYPEKLALLVPDFVATIPHDPCDGQPFRYRLAPDGYLLYSVAINRKDDDGKLSTNDSSSDPDWRWWSPLKE